MGKNFFGTNLGPKIGPDPILGTNTVQVISQD